MVFFNRESANNQSKEIAKDRLKFVLIHDRSKINPEIISKIKEEMLQVISKYLDVDMESCEINLKNEKRETILEANIPISKKN
ncbi:cell division topological specificity factor [Anaerobranca californiensis DSM 14826]|jgi:cell division topological specificity factor|uniref:Cell division topological specificity factor n=1 Tax=Anaerobranca californiensis DSM 14826 TaxID=1120989 RepID=A0A1M6NIU5_9FIRM|nr:cell division topological specificity factor MinE [Anaerobranca californiensis]SHJ95556.1 cell division topological specificity factor [Anaerobranca californiensis DSM 14826]